MIADENAVMPEGWLVDEPATIPDPDAEKPEEVRGYHAGKLIRRASLTRFCLHQWSDEEDGDWIAPAVPNPACESAAGCGPWTRPEIPNPAYKVRRVRCLPSALLTLTGLTVQGKWFAPLIDNPDYKGPWAPRKIANKDYYEDLTPSDFNKIAGIGFELWSMTDDILFDNVSWLQSSLHIFTC